MSRIISDEEGFKAMRLLLAEGKGVVFTPEGNSMLPFIRSGRDSVLLSPPVRPLETGDIILAKIGPRYILHRIIALHGDQVTLMGDGNLHEKERCTAADVIGIVTEIRKGDGRVVIPGKGRLWHMLKPIRRYLLAFYKRVVL